MFLLHFAKVNTMKINHVFLFYSVKFAGGTSDLMFKLVKNQRRNGIDAKILTGNHKIDRDLCDRIGNENVLVTKSMLDNFGFSIMPFLPFSFLYKAYRADLFHLHAYRTFQNIIVYVYCKLSNTPYIIDAHGAVPFYKKKNGLKKLFDYLIGWKMLKDASFLVAETEVGVTEYLDILHDVDKEKLKIISPPFDTEQFKDLPDRGEFRKMFGINPATKVIAFLGRIHEIKGNDFLIKGFEHYIKNHQDCLLVLIGPDDGHQNELELLIDELGIKENVLFTGYLDGDKKLSALVDADIVAQMSRREQGAWAPFEAILCGTPIIVSDHTGAGEDVKRIDAGTTVEFDDVIGLSAAISEIFANYTSEKHRARRAKQFIEKHMSLNARMSEYIALYESAIVAKEKK